MYMSGLAFGVTSENPGRINVVDLPEDADELIDRTNSFIVYKNVANTPCEGDTLIFSMAESGKLIFLHRPKLLNHFNNKRDRRLWLALWSRKGSTQSS